MYISALQNLTYFSNSILASWFFIFLAFLLGYLSFLFNVAVSESKVANCESLYYYTIIIKPSRFPSGRKQNMKYVGKLL